jgi:hypothetical protein
MTTTTTTVTFSDLAPTVGDTPTVILQKHALAWANAEVTVADLEALLAEAQAVRSDRHWDLLVAIADLRADKVANDAIAKAIKATGVAFSNDLVGHAVRAYAVAQHDEADGIAAVAYDLRRSITNAATNRGVGLKAIDAALKGITDTAKAITLVDALVKAEPVVEADEAEAEAEGDDADEADGKTDAQRLEAIANTIKGMKGDGTATPEAVQAIVQALTALVTPA